MPTVPTYTRQENWQVPSVETSASSPVRLKEAYPNNLSRTGKLLSQAQEYWFGKDKKGRSSSPKEVNLSAQETQDVSYESQVNMRAELITEAEKQVVQDGFLSVEKLDDFARRHFSPQEADGSAGRDYLVLRQTARNDSLRRTREISKQGAETEARLVRQVGALVPTKEALNEYLSMQIPAYEAHLRQTGETEENIRLAAAELRTQTLAQHIRRTLGVGDWQTAERVFSENREGFSVSVQAELSAKIRTSFAQARAEELWGDAQKDISASVDEKLRFCRARLDEKDPELKRAVLVEITGKVNEEKQREKLACFSVYEKLLRGSREEIKPILLLGKLGEVELKQAVEVAGNLFRLPLRPNEKNFVRLYFHGSCQEIFSAWRAHELSADEYWLLQAVRARREALGADEQGYFLYTGITQFCNRQKYDSPTLWRVAKAVLCGGLFTEEQVSAWEKIKKLLNH